LNEPVLTIWDVPVLEPDWPERLERRSRLSGPIVAIMGFADRTSVAQAKTRGAIACLELPYNVDDLLDVIDRAARSLPLERWPTPARIELPHRLPPRSRRRKVERETPAAVPWSDRDRKPTIP
jgi:FixJ family two-component response regulator